MTRKQEYLFNVQCWEVSKYVFSSRYQQIIIKKNMSICSSHAFCVKIENIVFLSTQVFCRSIIYTSIAFKIIYDTM